MEYLAYLKWKYIEDKITSFYDRTNDEEKDNAKMLFKKVFYATFNSTRNIKSSVNAVKDKANELTSKYVPMNTTTAKTIVKKMKHLSQIIDMGAKIKARDLLEFTPKMQTIKQQTNQQLQHEQLQELTPQEQLEDLTPQEHLEELTPQELKQDISFVFKCPIGILVTINGSQFMVNICGQTMNTKDAKELKIDEQTYYTSTRAN